MSELALVKISVPKPYENGRVEIFRKMIQGLIAAHEQPSFTMFAEARTCVQHDGEAGRTAVGPQKIVRQRVRPW